MTETARVMGVGVDKKKTNGPTVTAGPEPEKRMQLNAVIRLRLVTQRNRANIILLRRVGIYMFCDLYHLARVPFYQNTFDKG